MENKPYEEVYEFLVVEESEIPVDAQETIIYVLSLKEDETAYGALTEQQKQIMTRYYVLGEKKSDMAAEMYPGLSPSYRVTKLNRSLRRATLQMCYRHGKLLLNGLKAQALLDTEDAAFGARLKQHEERRAAIIAATREGKE